MKNVCILDFDGTLVKKDTLKYIMVKEWFFRDFDLLFLLPVLLIKTLLLPRNKQIKIRSVVKQKILKNVKDLPIHKYRSYIEHFRENLNWTIINDLNKKDFDIIIVTSASEEGIIKDVLKNVLNVDHIISNKIDDINVKNFITCWHKEKVRRVEDLLFGLYGENHKKFKYTLFTDSIEDGPLIKYSDKTNYIKKVANYNMISLLLQTLRPIRWYKNVIIFVGVFLFLIVIGGIINNFTYQILIPFFLTCIFSSANYGMNEVVDAETDKKHPEKKFRPVPSGLLDKRLVIGITVFLYIIGLLSSYLLVNEALFVTYIIFILNAFVYNLKPLRVKDIPVLDFTFEALNNPIRIAIGWYAVSMGLVIVPSSVLIAFWGLGIFFMAGKRFGELRYIKDKNLAADYRKSLGFYTETNLLVTLLIAFGLSSYMAGAMTVKHFHNLILAIPLYLIWGGIYLKYAHDDDTFVKDPERIFEKKNYVLFSLFIIFITVALLLNEDLYLSNLILGL